MNTESIIGIDLGGTNIRAGQVQGDTCTSRLGKQIDGTGSVDDVMKHIYKLSDQLMNNSVKAIGIGVPGIVDLEHGIVYDVQNIPSWKEVPLKSLMEKRYHIPVMVNNDANCFVLGEYHFGKNKNSDSMIGLTIGTGLGCGIIINKKLYAGANCGAGEIGMVDYLDKNFDYYASGRFFRNVHQTNGEIVFKRAMQGDQQAIEMFDELGVHLGNAIRMILYTYDTSLIVLGGSVGKAWDYFSGGMFSRIETFAYPGSVKRLRIEVSKLEDSALLGAAALYYDTHI